MRRYTTSCLLTFSLCLTLPVAAMPPDALINNTLSVPGEINKAVIVDSELAEVRGQVWPLILGVVAVDLALQAYFYGVYLPNTRGGG